MEINLETHNSLNQQILCGYTDNCLKLYQTGDYNTADSDACHNETYGTGNITQKVIIIQQINTLMVSNNGYNSDASVNQDGNSNKADQDIVRTTVLHFIMMQI